MDGKLLFSIFSILVTYYISDITEFQRLSGHLCVKIKMAQTRSKSNARTEEDVPATPLEEGMSTPALSLSVPGYPSLDRVECSANKLGATTAFLLSGQMIEANVCVLGHTVYLGMDK